MTRRGGRGSEREKSEEVLKGKEVHANVIPVCCSASKLCLRFKCELCVHTHPLIKLLTSSTELFPLHFPPILSMRSLCRPTPPLLASFPFCEEGTVPFAANEEGTGDPSLMVRDEGAVEWGCFMEADSLLFYFTPTRLEGAIDLFFTIPPLFMILRPAHMRIPRCERILRPFGRDYRDIRTSTFRLQRVCKPVDTPMHMCRRMCPCVFKSTCT